MTAELPSELEFPSFLMSFPFTVGNLIPNNAWMNAEPYDLPRAFTQWMTLYRRLTVDGVVWLLPTDGRYQDRPFVADVGSIMHHRQNCVAISRIESEGRIGEEMTAARFFRAMGYDVQRSPFRWEGESELKHLRDNIYIGGVGQRSSAEAFRWISDTFDAEVVTVSLNDPLAYHLDACLFPLTNDSVLLAVSLFDKSDVAKIEKISEIIEIPKDHVYDDWANIVRIGRHILYNGSLESADDLQAVLYGRGFEIERIDLSEFEKSGAGLSCLVSHLNERNRVIV